MKTFAQRVIDIVSRLPSGQTMTYKEVAAAVGNPNASRAVGIIMSKNFRPEVPCHRVVRSDGRVGGYNRGGSAMKTKILQKEAVKLQGNSR